MKNPEIKSLPIGVRVFPAPAVVDGNIRSKKGWQQPEGMLVIHTVARSDAMQKLLMGNYRLIVGGQTLEEGFFYENLSKPGRQALRDYVASHCAENGDQIWLLTRREFLQVFFELAYKARCLVIASNLPFHLSRLAFNAAPARGYFAGGFSLGLWTYRDKNGRERLNGFRPRICIKYIDNKRAFIGFTARNSPDPEDLIPDGSPSGEPEPGYRFPGYFLDLRTLAFALTDDVYSFEAACEAFGVEYATEPALIPEKYIRDIRRTVMASAELAAKLLVELAEHPIALPPTQAFSPASIGKAYLRAMGIEGTR
jgi:hypothetical protein